MKKGSTDFKARLDKNWLNFLFPIMFIRWIVSKEIWNQIWNISCKYFLSLSTPNPVCCSHILWPLSRYSLLEMFSTHIRFPQQEESKINRQVPENITFANLFSLSRTQYRSIERKSEEWALALVWIVRWKNWRRNCENKQ